MTEPGNSKGGRAGSGAYLAALFAVTVWTACFYFPRVWDRLGIGEADKPFLDLYGLLASGERDQAGFDAFQPNPLDPYHRPNVYSTWWLATGRIGLTRSDTAWVGVSLLLATLGVALATVRPANWRQSAGLAAVLISPAFLMAVSRANNDLVIFILVGLALLALRKDSRTGYYFAAAILAVAAALKYYPLAAVVVLYSAGSRRQFFAALAIYAGVLLLAAPSLPEALEAAARYKPRPEWLYAFGAPMLWRNFHWEGSTLWIVPALAVIAWAWPRRPMNSVRAEIGSGTAEARAFLVGSTLIVGCFFLGASYAYKLVFSLWLLPGLWRASASGFAPRAAQVTSALLYFVLWFEGSAAALLNLAPVVLSSETVDRSLKSVLTIQQISTWALMACLLRWIFAAVFSQAKTLLRSPARA